MAHVPGVNEGIDANTQPQQPNQQRRSTTRPRNQRAARVGRNTNSSNAAGARRYPQIRPANNASLRHRIQNSAPMSMNNGNQSLQSHLIRQQIIAGIAPENIMTINQQQRQANDNRQATPNLVQITNEGVSFPSVSPATFIPHASYSNPLGNVNETNHRPVAHPGRYGQFLGVPDVGPRPTLEQRATPITWESMSPNFPWGHPAYPPPAPMGTNTPIIGARTRIPHGYQRTPNPLVSNFNPNEVGYGGTPVVKDEVNGYQGQQGMPPYLNPSLDDEFPPRINGPSSPFSVFPKTEPDADQPLQSIPDYPIPPIDSRMPSSTTSHTHGFSVAPKAETDVDEILKSISNYPIPNIEVPNLEDELFGGMNGPTHDYPVAPKSELDADQSQQGMSDYLFQYFDRGLPAGLSDHTHAPPSVPRIKPEHNPYSTEPYGMGRLARPYTPQAYRSMTTRVSQDISQSPSVVGPHGPTVVQWQRPPSLESVKSRHPSAAPEDGNDQKPADKDVSQTINILHTIITHPDIALRITEELGIEDLINLQITSKAFCTFTIKYLPKIIRLQALHKSRVACHIFPWRCYQRLWFKRPALDYDAQRLSGVHSNGPVTAYTVSLRWLQMVRYRDETVHSIIHALTSAGYGFPYRYKPAIFKLWFLMDIPDMKRRMWTIQNRNLWTDLDLFMATLFIVRIDLYVKTARENASGGQRRLIMAQRGLKFCLDVLTGNILRTEMELLKELVRWRYNPLPGEVLQGDLFGVPAAEVGSLQYEYYGRGQRDGRKKLQRPDQIVLLETRRRQLNLDDMYQRIFLYAQPQEFTVCDRPNSLWDEEIKRAVRSLGVRIQDILRLD
ncbi:hypothetical protein ASPVEDRAFT_34151 [Aspergillus versicolor CBS 583.65]|uniref:Uncharacterized protein n=1 Tax=Aspergillus versicolor CBS 583.65 TaxID=1036611 RepID=A0A1L9Q2L6_ASPVE|nr:uncharacterized protein ASPVEDRAFT_34151 [Aspergillus versicolor CBS 583.65]OJJ07971.1 hypothetical protein ASPVEDRAFT_34151 [Aspergillus versicolor CBS 583.65]